MWLHTETNDGGEVVMTPLYYLQHVSTKRVPNGQLLPTPEAISAQIVAYFHIYIIALSLKRVKKV